MLKLLVFDAESDLGWSLFIVDEKKHSVFVANVLIACHRDLLQLHYVHNSEMCRPCCVYKVIGGGIKSITQQVYLMMFIRG